MADEAPPQKPAESFESCLDELEKVVKELEAGELPLERSLELFEKGMALSETCRKQLEEAETRVEMLIRKGRQDAARAVPPRKRMNLANTSPPSSSVVDAELDRLVPAGNDAARDDLIAPCATACSPAASASGPSSAWRRRAPCRNRRTGW